jgi:hypothetical protein
VSAKAFGPKPASQTGGPPGRLTGVTRLYRRGASIPCPSMPARRTTAFARGQPCRSCVASWRRSPRRQPRTRAVSRAGRTLGRLGGEDRGPHRSEQDGGTQQQPARHAAAAPSTVKGSKTGEPAGSRPPRPSGSPAPRPPGRRKSTVSVCSCAALPVWAGPRRPVAAARPRCSPALRRIAEVHGVEDLLPDE